MNTALWVLASLLCAAYFVGGLIFILLPKARYNAIGGASADWVQDFSQGQMQAIGGVKIIGALGLIVPALVGAQPQLAPMAAIGLMLLMAGAATTRFRRREWKFMVGDMVFLALFGFVAWGRFMLVPLPR